MVIDVVLFCAKQNIPLRGHRESEEALSRANIIELFEFAAKFEPQIQLRLNEH